MNRITLTIAALLVVTGAFGQVGPPSPAMSCAQAAGLVRAQGAIVLGTGGPTYDRFVADRRFCQPTEQTRAAFVPTRDNPACFIGYRCFEPGPERQLSR